MLLGCFLVVVACLSQPSGREQIFAQRLSEFMGEESHHIKMSPIFFSGGVGASAHASTIHILPQAIGAIFESSCFGGRICGSEEARYIWAVAVGYIWALEQDTIPRLDNVTDDHCHSRLRLQIFPVSRSGIILTVCFV